MSYPPPPGLKSSSASSSTSTPPSHPSLPARPPPSALPPAGFKPAFNTNRGGSSNSYAAYQAFAPRQVSTPTVSAPPSGFSSYQAQPSYSAPQSYYQGPQQDQSYGVPQIQNPFPLPGQNGAGRGGRFDSAVDPEMEAQIAQWQSAYASKDSDQRGGRGPGAGSATSANAAPLGSGRGETYGSHTDGDNAGGKGADKKPTVVRSGGGKSWTDESLLEWDPSHFRIFVGNLAGEVTDESLLKAFSRWPSVQKARVVRDKRTTKSKGFGFVSFSDGDDFFQAAREMNGKYIGSHPVLIKRSTTEIKPVVPKDKGHGKGKNGKGGKHNGGGGGNAHTGAGVQKAGSKTKGGLKILG